MVGNTDSRPPCRGDVARWIASAWDACTTETVLNTWRRIMSISVSTTLDNGQNYDATNDYEDPIGAIGLTFGDGNDDITEQEVFSSDDEHDDPNDDNSASK